jgi:hypothetical protein
MELKKYIERQNTLKGIANSYTYRFFKDGKIQFPTLLGLNKEYHNLLNGEKNEYFTNEEHIFVWEEIVRLLDLKTGIVGSIFSDENNKINTSERIVTTIRTNSTGKRQECSLFSYGKTNEYLFADLELRYDFIDVKLDI